MSKSNENKSATSIQKMMNPIDKESSNIYTRQELFNMLYCLISYNSPHGSEEIYHDFLPTGGTFDEKGNYHLQIGEDNDSQTLFCCHMDTVGSSIIATNPIIEGERYFACGNNRAHCLGGDDKCGFLILNALARYGVKGTYIYHVGEERGCIGSTYIRDEKIIDFTKFKRAIQFDRRGTTSVITKMMGSTKVCSKEFADALCTQIGLDFKKDDGGSYTDVAKYNELIPEVTNLSCGYSREHGSSEKIDILWLIDDFIPALYNVDWENLPTVRDHKDKAANTEVRHYYGNYNSGSVLRDFESTEQEIFELISKINSIKQRNTVSKKKHNKDYVNKLLKKYYDQGAINISEMEDYEANVLNIGNDSSNKEDESIDESAFQIYETEADCYLCEHCLQKSNNFENVMICGKSTLLCESCAQIVDFENQNS